MINVGRLQSFYLLGNILKERFQTELEYLLYERRLYFLKVSSKEFFDTLNFHFLKARIMKIIQRVD